MKKQNRAVQITLGVSVLIIWGMVAYRFNRLSKGTNSKAENAEFVMPEATPALEQDTFRLVLNYPDPFLSGSALISEKKNSISSGQTARTNQVNSVKPPQGIPPPSIQYKGFSMDNKGRIRARLAVNGKGMTLANGDVVGNLNVLSIFKDSVQIKWEGKKYTLRRQKSK